MVMKFASLSGSGVKDWILQRISAVYLAAYFIFLFTFVLLHQPLQYFDWQQLFALFSMKIASVIALFALLTHSWIGIWTICTDYLKPLWLRICVQFIVLLALLSYLIWGILILSIV
jgi:succinate dehydrogenase / fumarate reductase membrane anchor subunit